MARGIPTNCPPKIFHWQDVSLAGQMFLMHLCRGARTKNTLLLSHHRNYQRGCRQTLKQSSVILANGYKVFLATRWMRHIKQPKSIASPVVACFALAS